MPLVVPKVGNNIVYVQTEEMLAEILGHSDMDGENWSVGDYILFETGILAAITSHEEWFTWTELDPGCIEQVKARISAITGKPTLKTELVGIINDVSLREGIRERMLDVPSGSNWQLIAILLGILGIIFLIGVINRAT